MPRTYTQLFYHVVFSTRDRKPQLTGDLKARLVPYIGGIVREMGGLLVACGGPSDHLHSVVLLPPRISVSDAAQAIKGRPKNRHKNRDSHLFSCSPPAAIRMSTQPPRQAAS